MLLAGLIFRLWLYDSAQRTRSPARPELELEQGLELELERGLERALSRPHPPCPALPCPVSPVPWRGAVVIMNSMLSGRNDT